MRGKKRQFFFESTGSGATVLLRHGFVAAAVVLSCVVFAAGQGRQEKPVSPGELEARPAPHEKMSSDPWMPRSSKAPAGAVEHCGPWVRGPYESIQVNVDEKGCNIVGDAANEPSIAIDPTDPNKIVICWRQFDTIESGFRQAGYGYSRDAGRTWTFPGSLTPGIFGSDPVLMSNADGVFYYLSINSDEMRLFRSFDGGLTWGPPIQVAVHLRDKPWMSVDVTNGMGSGNIYIHAIPGWFTRSTDGGVTFPVEVFGAGGHWGTQTTGLRGEVYTVSGALRVLLWSNAYDPSATPTFEFVARVDLGGDFARFGGADDPNDGGLLGQPWIDVDRSNGPARGNLYVLSSVEPPSSKAFPFGVPLDVMFAASWDDGQTWTEPVRVNDDLTDNGAWQWFGTMSVAPNGRIDAVWNDTRNTGKTNLCELYYSFSTDQGETWSENVPVSPVFDSWIGWLIPRRKLGDYYHAISDNLGMNVAYAATFNGMHDIYFLRITQIDCNDNGVTDIDDITEGTSADCNANEIPDECERDCNGNTIPDECEAFADFTTDGQVNTADYAEFLSRFQGPVAITLCPLFDADYNGHLDLRDFAAFQNAVTNVGG